jgi:hypothetical protein
MTVLVLLSLSSAAATVNVPITGGASSSTTAASKPVNLAFPSAVKISATTISSPFIAVIDPSPGNATQPAAPATKTSSKAGKTSSPAGKIL